MHSQDEHLRLFRGILKRFFDFLLGSASTLFLSFSGFTKALILYVDGRYGLQDGHVEGRLAKLVEHEQMVGQVGKLRLEVEPVFLVTHKLVNRCVPVAIHTIVMRLDQVALNVVECFHLNSAHFLLASAGSHGRVFSAINELADDEDSHH